MFKNLTLTLAIVMLFVVATIAHSHDEAWHSHGEGTLDHDANGFASSDHSNVKLETKAEYTRILGPNDDGIIEEWHCPSGVVTIGGVAMDIPCTPEKKTIKHKVYAEHSHPLKSGHSHGDDTPVENIETTVTTPVVRNPNPVGGGTATVESSPATTNVPQSKPATVDDKAPQKIDTVPVADLKFVYETEWMLKDLGLSAPQWIEIYNSNSVDVNIKGWTFEYTIWRNLKRHVESKILSDFKIPARSAIILATRAIRANRSDVDKDKVYVLDIGYHLKGGWKITAADGTLISQHPVQFGVGKNNIPGAWQGTVNWREQIRTSFEYRKSATVPNAYYGHSRDVGSPGFYESPAPAAPSLRKLKRVTMWSKLKQK